SYTVAKENLGTEAGLVAAAALLTDYIMTVAVSIAGGIAAITSAYHGLIPHTVLLSVLSIAILAIVNLRGVRESGLAFSVPTYVFVLMMVALIAYGGYRAFLGSVPAGGSGVVKVDPVSLQQHGLASVPAGFALAYLLIRGFAEGCAAMTGTEAISNGVMAFKQPAQKNAAATLGTMVAILAAFFLGTSLLARHYGVMPTTTDTVLSQLADHIFGRGALYYVFQYSTFAILVLAANTAFADFPRLSGILANDGYMPRQLAARGDRLAFSNGIIALGLIAAVILWIFGGQTNALIPLYAVGVFICFTLSQMGMVMHWLRSRAPGWKWKAALNGIGGVATGIVSIIQVVTKFIEGAWIVVLIIPLIILVLRKIHQHYEQFAAEVEFKGQSPIAPLHHSVVVPVNGITKATSGALVYATTISDEVVAVYIEVDSRATAKMQSDWEEWDIGVPLVVIPSPYRSVLRPLVEYVENLRLIMPGELVTVVVPEIVPKRWWEHLLHNKTAFYIRTAFLFKPNVVVTTVPFLLGHAYRLRDLFEHDDRLDEVVDGTETIGPAQVVEGQVEAA
ncbi:MAG TPA: amino acid permease, partial [Gemmatimonadaceae bacterium]|nr:amino acid permease [Gemmatimonadaceae bacterium]